MSSFHTTTKTCNGKATSGNSQYTALTDHEASSGLYTISAKCHVSSMGVVTAEQAALNTEKKLPEKVLFLEHIAPNPFATAGFSMFAPRIFQNILEFLRTF